MDYLIEPGVLSDVGYLVSLLWVGVEDVLDEVSALGRDEFGDDVFAVEDFLVEVGGVGVFEG